MSEGAPPASGAFPQLPPALSLVGQVLDGRYRIIKLIGEGGMGEVYAAEHVHIAKRYAIKLLKAEIVSNAEAVARFRQEALKSSEIKHRNIIAIEDFNQLADGRIYMCMELLNGSALNDLIQQPIAVDRLLNILIQTGHGLAAAHARGIVHRDMKPENIFVTIDAQGQDVPKLLDFGIAKVSGNDGQNHLTRTGTIFGTPFYMAPEQALGNPVDARTDIYAVGVIMYECFAGSLPFQGESFMGILTQHITTEPEPVAQRAAKAGRQLPMGLTDIITRCMQKDPARRFSTMDELVNALIGVYRGIAGPGMSTYMEAFPVGSPQHMMQPTPPPMMPAGPHAATIGAATGGYAPPQSGPTGMVGSASSGMYSAGSSVVAPKRRKLGLVIAILVVLAAGGGIAALVLLQQDPGKKPQSGLEADYVAPKAGSAHVASGSSQVVAADAAAAATGSATTGPAATGSAATGSAATGSAATATGSNATTPPQVEQIEVVVMAIPRDAVGEVWADGKKLDDLPAQVKVALDHPLAIVIKAKGFKDKNLVLDGKKTKVTAKLDHLPGVVHHPIVPNIVQPPGQPDCSNSILDPHNKHCVNQYCNAHSEDVRCGAE